MNKLTLLVFVAYICPTIIVDGDWTKWTEEPCSVKCGMGVKKVSRNCTVGTTCTGKKSQKIKCFAGKKCGRAGGWSAWKDITSCSQQCGPGEKIQRRKCNAPVPAPNGDYCSGMHMRKQPCIIRKCTDVYTAWSLFSQCTSSCGPGTKRRSRKCLLKSPQ